MRGKQQTPPTDPEIKEQQAETAETEATGTADGAQASQTDTDQAVEQAALQSRLTEAEQKRDEYLDMAQRLQAEFDNYRRRNSAIRSEAWEDGARETVGLMLPVIDNLERAVEAAGEANTPLKSGVELVLKQMLELLEKRGVTVINRVGEPFDPELENAVMQADASEGEPGTVCTVLQKGYKTATRVIRHAMVRVVAAE